MRSNVRQIEKFIVINDNFKLTPHPLIVLSTVTYHAIKDNCIILADMNREHSHCRNNNDRGTTSFTIKSARCNVSSLVDDVWSIGKIFDFEQQQKIIGGYLILLCETTEQCLTSESRLSVLPPLRFLSFLRFLAACRGRYVVRRFIVPYRGRVDPLEMGL
jgi:hypothetical protein